MNAAKRYSIYALIPVIVFLLGMVFYKESVSKILDSNPHPELIYGIFGFLALGVVLTFAIFYRYAVEQKRLAIFLEEKATAAAHSIQDSENVSRRSASAERLKRVAKVAGGRDAPIYPIFSLLSMATRRMTIQEGRGAVERELEVYTKRITSWLSLPQFLGGLLIGMGLVGTFVGLLSALDEIALAISGLAGPSTGGDANGMFQVLIARLQKPMQSMGIAFSASLFGLMGSIIVGFMMVAVKRCAQEVVAHLRVETYKAVGESFGWADGSEDGEQVSEFAPGASSKLAPAPADPRIMALMERVNDQMDRSMSNTSAFAGDMTQATKTLESAIADLANYVKQLRDSQVESERNRLVQRELALLDLSGRLDSLVATKQSSQFTS
jgi:biopolymer transport protein ExbB/TolQ